MHPIDYRETVLRLAGALLSIFALLAAIFAIPAAAASRRIGILLLLLVWMFPLAANAQSVSTHAA